MNTTCIYATKARDLTAMSTADENGWLPLHHALKDKAPLGSIKLLLSGNPAALQVAVEMVYIHYILRVSLARQRLFSSWWK